MMGALWRRWRGVLFVLAVPLPLLIAVAEATFDPRDYLTDRGAAGPYVVSDGRVRADWPAIRSVPAGELFGWVSTVCPKGGTVMIGRVELRDERGRVAASRARRWHADERGCGPQAGLLRVPPDTPLGPHRLCRVAVLRPDSWLPLVAQLGCLDITITAPREGAP